ncbi:MAG TPA: acetamidase/formamidase family protein [Caldilineaceae bacterium]|nr:acetamidase/formamidase family protein [Caldilineaceae bacterium]
MTTHHFVPDHYFNTIGSHPPVLRIAAGDTVVTTSVDARGVDHHGRTVAQRGNPMTGPFYVEGAEPGDTLVVRLDRLRPNRPRGWTRKMVAPNVVDPEYVPQLPWPASNAEALATWAVDTEAWTATLEDPADTRLGALTLPLAPMVGCFGVAPAGGEAISTATSGPHGGNMDYRGFVEGVMVYFPVFVPGALFHIGDGHALQGDGEIVGTGIEISFDIQFTVQVRKGKSIGWPRGENADYIFTCGNARPLDQCVQHATTEMIRWLQDDYGLDAVGAHILLGQAVEYDLGNIYDPAYTMVCKVPKRLLTVD